MPVGGPGGPGSDMLLGPVQDGTRISGFELGASGDCTGVDAKRYATKLNSRLHLLPDFGTDAANE